MSDKKCWGLTENDFLYAIIFDEELAHEIAGEYNFEIEELDDMVEYEAGGTIN